jgi:hypothetical protein
MRRTRRLLSAVASLALAAGCGGDRPKLVPVTGKVVHHGKALTAGSVWLHADAGNPYAGEKPSCQLALDGSFVIRTYPYGEGAPPGPYKVTLSPELANRIRLPAYSDPAKTPLRLDVPDAGVKDHVFEVK